MSHITLAASETAIQQLFATVVKNFHYATSDTETFGPFSASYSMAMHLSGGSIVLNNDNTVEITGVDIVWDTLKANICFNLPGFCVGGWCIIPDPFDGCWVRLPEWCIGGPQCIGPDLSGILSTRISDVKASLDPAYFVDPQRTPGQTDLDAEDSGWPNKWKIFLYPVFVHIDPIDVGATAGNLLEQLLNQVIDNVLGPFPDFIKDIIKAILGPIIDLLKSILGIATDITDWLSNLFNHQFDILGRIETAVAQYLASEYPLFDFEDPFPILPAEAGLIPVKIPIRNLTCRIDPTEMVVQADVG